LGWKGLGIAISDRAGALGTVCRGAQAAIEKRTTTSRPSISLPGRAAKQFHDKNRLRPGYFGAEARGEAAVMATTINAIYRYPVKGLSAEKMIAWL
jgi:hypothetical protein